MKNKKASLQILKKLGASLATVILAANVLMSYQPGLINMVIPQAHASVPFSSVFFSPSSGPESSFFQLLMLSGFIGSSDAGGTVTVTASCDETITSSSTSGETPSESGVGTTSYTATYSPVPAGSNLVSIALNFFPTSIGTINCAVAFNSPNFGTTNWNPSATVTAADPTEEATFDETGTTTNSNPYGTGTQTETIDITGSGSITASLINISGGTVVFNGSNSGSAPFSVDVDITAGGSGVNPVTFTLSMDDGSGSPDEEDFTYNFTSEPYVQSSLTPNPITHAVDNHGTTVVTADYTRANPSTVISTVTKQSGSPAITLNTISGNLQVQYDITAFPNLYGLQTAIFEYEDSVGETEDVTVAVTIEDAEPTVSYDFSDFLTNLGVGALSEIKLNSIPDGITTGDLLVTGGDTDVLDQTENFFLQFTPFAGLSIVGGNTQGPYTDASFPITIGLSLDKSLITATSDPIGTLQIQGQFVHNNDDESFQWGVNSEGRRRFEIDTSAVSITKIGEDVEKQECWKVAVQVSGNENASLYLPLNPESVKAPRDYQPKGDSPSQYHDAGITPYELSTFGQGLPITAGVNLFTSLENTPTEDAGNLTLPLYYGGFLKWNKYDSFVYSDVYDETITPSDDDLYDGTVKWDLGMGLNLDVGYKYAAEFSQTDEEEAFDKYSLGAGFGLKDGLFTNVQYPYKLEGTPSEEADQVDDYFEHTHGGIYSEIETNF